MPAGWLVMLVLPHTAGRDCAFPFPHPQAQPYCRQYKAQIILVRSYFLLCSNYRSQWRIWYSLVRRESQLSLSWVSLSSQCLVWLQFQFERYSNSHGKWGFSISPQLPMELFQCPVPFGLDISLGRSNIFILLLPSGSLFPNMTDHLLNQHKPLSWEACWG